MSIVLETGYPFSAALDFTVTVDRPSFLVVGQLFADNPLCVTSVNDTPYLGFFGLTAELASHQIDVASWMFGMEPEFVVGVGGLRAR